MSTLNPEYEGSGIPAPLGFSWKFWFIAELFFIIFLQWLSVIATGKDLFTNFLEVIL